MGSRVAGAGVLNGALLPLMWMPFLPSVIVPGVQTLGFLLMVKEVTTLVTFPSNPAQD